MAPAEDPGSVPNTQTRQLESTVTPVPWDLVVFLGTYPFRMCDTHKLM